MGQEYRASQRLYADAIVAVRTLNVSDELSAGRGRPLVCLLYAGVRGETAEVNAILAPTAGADVVLLRDTARVGSQWLERMRAAAHCDTTVISASALSCEGDSLAVTTSIAVDAGGVTRRADPHAAAEAVARMAKRVYPRIARPEGPCVYLCHEALELLGGLDEEAVDVAHALTIFGKRALGRGMLHVAADDVYVTVEQDDTQISLGSMQGPKRSRSAHSYSANVLPPGDPADADWSEEHGVLSRCLDTAQIALDGLSVTIDARALGPVLAGTQVYTIELVLALARLGDVALRVVVPPDLSPEAVKAFASVPAVELVPYAEAARGGLALSHVVHRPQQVFTEDDLALLRLLGRRIVIGQQDLIAYRNPTYHADLSAWQRYRHVTRLALAVADRVVFFSRHALLDAVREDLIDESRAVETGIGGDELWARHIPQSEPPTDGLLDAPFLLCLGTDYEHKNRPFAIAILAALRECCNWSGRLVFAGGRAAHGSSAEDERAELAAHPDLIEAVIDLGSVSEAGRSWLMEHAQAVLYPSLYEGFGLLPFEAARAGIPCLYAAQASLGEAAGSAAATLVPWDAQASARAVAALLVDGPPRERHLVQLRDAAARRSWAEVAGDLRNVYEDAIASPHRASVSLHWQEYERHIAELDRQLSGLRDSVGALAGPDQGGLLTEAQGRGLLRIASRPLLRRLLFGPVGLFGRRW
jgi:glycosyltransferase involved in cell wall biosynthesis